MVIVLEEWGSAIKGLGRWDGSTSTNRYSGSDLCSLLFSYHLTVLNLLKDEQREREARHGRPWDVGAGVADVRASKTRQPCSSTSSVKTRCSHSTERGQQRDTVSQVKHHTLHSGIVVGQFVLLTAPSSRCWTIH